jgi:putative aldouronate transport system permease protein
MSYVGLSLFNNNGFLNTLLDMLGMEAVDWYSRVNYWPWILVLTQVWKTIGFNSIIYLASICGISPEFFEAARLDGASRWQQIKYIMLPHLKLMMIITTIMALGHIFNSDFGLFYQMPMNQGQLYPVTQTIDVYVFNALQKMHNINMSAAASVFQSIVGFITILAANGIIRKIDSESALF